MHYCFPFVASTLHLGQGHKYPVHVQLVEILWHRSWHYRKQEGLAVASIARDDPSTLPVDDPFPRAHM